LTFGGSGRRVRAGGKFVSPHLQIFDLSSHPACSSAYALIVHHGGPEAIVHTC
jgi:hypothetical protein